MFLITHGSKEKSKGKVENSFEMKVKYIKICGMQLQSLEESV